MKLNGIATLVVLAAALTVRAGELKEGWAEKIYEGSEAVGEVTWVDNAYRGKGAMRMVWKSGAMKFGAEKEVKTDLTGLVDWRVTGVFKSEGDYGYAGAAMEFFNEKGESLGLVNRLDPVVARDWSKIEWSFSAPKNAKRHVLHILSLDKEPVMFADVQAKALPGIDKGEIVYDVMALPAEWNKDWNGGEVKATSFTDAPLPLSFLVKGDSSGMKDLQLVVEAPAELELKDSYSPKVICECVAKPVTTPVVIDGRNYVRYVYAKQWLFMKISPGGYDVDGAGAIVMAFAPKADLLDKVTKHRIYYRMEYAGKKGRAASMELTCRPMPKGLRMAKDFKVFSWCDDDRHFASDEAYIAAAKAYEAAGVNSLGIHSAKRGCGRVFRLKEINDSRPAKYLTWVSLGDYWFVGHSGTDGEVGKKLGIRMAVMADKADKSRNRTMCPEYFNTDPKLHEYLSQRIKNVLKAAKLTDGDWIALDWEPWGSAKWCHCDTCHAAFAKFAGLDHVPTTAEIAKEELQDKWANFRCHQTEIGTALMCQWVRAYNPKILCIDYDYIMQYGNEAAMRGFRRSCGKDTQANEKWLDGHLCSYYHTLGKWGFDSMRNNVRTLRKLYIPLGAIGGYGGYLRPGEVINPQQLEIFALSAFVNGCAGYGFYSGVYYDGEMLMAMMRVQDTVAKWEGLPWGKKDGKCVPVSKSSQFAYTSTIMSEGDEVVALFNFDMGGKIEVELEGKTHALDPLEVRFVTVPRQEKQSTKCPVLVSEENES